MNKPQLRTIPTGYDPAFYEVSVNEVFSETNLKDLASILDIVLTPSSYMFTMDEKTLVREGKSIIRYSMKPIAFLPEDYREDAKSALQDLRATYPKELLQSCTKYLSKSKVNLLISLLKELNSEN